MFLDSYWQFYANKTEVCDKICFKLVQKVSEESQGLEVSKEPNILAILLVLMEICV